jgi:predicted O-methyltransferase YrrM
MDHHFHYGGLHDMNSENSPTPNDYSEIAAFVDALEGWMTPAQGARLFAAARTCPSPGQIVEIGSFRGKSTVVLATAAATGVKIIAIDPHAGNDRGPEEWDGFADQASEDHDRFLHNLAAGGVADRVHHLRAFSDAAHPQVTGPVDVLYVDGAHRYGPARADLRDWGARVSPGGTMLIHDSFSSVGVTMAILRELLIGSRWRYIARSGSLTEYRADLPDALSARLRNAGRQLSQMPYFGKNLLIKLALSTSVGSRLLGRICTAAGRPIPPWPY